MGNNRFSDVKRVDQIFPRWKIKMKDCLVLLHPVIVDFFFFTGFTSV